jgi:hypothetical protein
MKRFFILAGMVVLGTGLVCALGIGYFLWTEGHGSTATAATPPAATPAAVVPAPPVRLRPLPDVDALARRLPYHQEVYAKVRDEALAAYAQMHPGSHPFDAEARETLKLASYLWVWGDYYGEGLWPIAIAHGRHVEDQGCLDQIWNSLYEIHWYADHRSSDDQSASQLTACENRLGLSAYPADFKLWAYHAAIGNLISAKTDSAVQPPLSTSLQALPDLAAKAVACYRDLIRQRAPPAFLYQVGCTLLQAAQNDEPTLKQISTGLDQAFAAEDRSNPLSDVLDGQFYVNDAWNARGCGYAQTVTQEGWNLLAQRLGRADDMLTDIYARSPSEPGLAKSMMTVVLGEQKPRDQMELWFQRGLQVNPNDFSLYMAKRWYLLPRWYGSDQDVWNFGLECAKSTNWAAKIPMVLVEAVSDRADRDPTTYAQPEIWGPLEKVYREYLSRFPNSIHYRSLFALSAAQGGHWDVAKEQFKILGDDWDPDVFPDTLYADTIRAVNAH